MKKSTQLVGILTSTAIAGLLTFANVTYAETDSGKDNYSQMTDAEKAAKKEKKAAKKEERLNRMAQELGLNESQKVQIQSLMQSNKSETKPMREEMRTLKKELKTLDAGSSEYAAKVSRRAELKSQMKAYKISQSEQIASILTTEQFAKWEEMKSKKKGKKGEKKSKMES